MRMLKIVAALLLSVVAVYVFALTYRYEPVAGSQTNLGTITVWDRWNNRVCIVSIAKENKPVCSVEQLKY